MYTNQNNTRQCPHSPPRRKHHRILFALLAIFLVVLFLWKICIPAVTCMQRSHLPSVSLTSTGSYHVSAKGLNSSNVVLIRRQDGRILMDKGSTQKIYPASMTKIMTVLVALQKTPFLHHKIQITSDILTYAQKQDASLAGFHAGERVQAEDLMYGALLPSGGECCIALARSISGSETAFVALMNQEAKKIGMTGTHFVNSTGLPNVKHYATVKDMALLLDYALQDSTFRSIFTSHTHQCADGITVTSTVFGSKYSTRLINGAILGGKTGYTNKAGHCLASLALVNGSEYILVTAHAIPNGAHIQDAVKVYNRL